MEQKICSKCKESKSRELFGRDKRASDGKSSWCRSCHCKKTTMWKSENVGPQYEYRKMYARRLNSRFLACKKSARLRGIEFDLNFSEYKELVDGECFYCDGKIDTIKNRSGHGLDRADNKFGYLYDNLVPCCSKCNKIKNNFLSLEETLLAVEAIVKHRDGN